MIGLCESFPYCRSVLEERFPGVPIVEDVADVVRRPPKPWVGCGVLTGASPYDQNELVDRVEGGGFGPFWGLFLGCVRALGPSWVVHETFPRFLDTDGEQPQADLAILGYDAAWFLLPSGAFDCPGSKDRLFLVGGRREDPGHERTFGTDLLSRVVGPRTWPAPEPDVCRMAERLPEGVDTHLVRLQALGNATLPQSAAYLLGLIHDAELSRNTPTA